MQAKQQSTALERFFCGLAEHTFEVKLGIVDPPLVDYLSELLVHGVRTEQLHSVRTPRGQAIHELGLMVKEAETRIGTARRAIHRCIGDFAMHGKRAYLIASSIPTDQEDAAPSDVLKRLGTEFEMCAYGLREVRREWEDASDDPSVPLIA